jgi:hypothetical protein
MGQDVAAYLADEAREREFQHQEVGGMLVSPNLAQGNCAWFVAAGSAVRDGIASWIGDGVSEDSEINLTEQEE